MAQAYPNNNPRGIDELADGLDESLARLFSMQAYLLQRTCGCIDNKAVLDVTLHIHSALIRYQNIKHGKA